MQISSINKISNKINTQVGKVFEYATKNKFIAKSLEQGYNEPAKFAAKMFIVSIVTKDLVGCYYYTTQSLNNKRIPEEKRKFVAALDLMQGIINVGGQILIGTFIDSKWTPKLLSKYTGVIKNKTTGEERYVNPSSPLASDNIIGVTKKVLFQKADEIKAKYGVDVSKLTPLEVNNIGEHIIGRIGRGSKRFKAFEAGFGIFIAAIATTALTKRALNPLISTPLAGWFKENYFDKKAKKAKRQHDRVYYEWVNLASKQDNKLDKTSFRKIASR